MRNLPQGRNRISRKGLAATSTVLALAAMQVLTVIAASAQAQTFTTLHSFDWTDGENPTAELIQATDGNFTGQPRLVGRYGRGTVFIESPRAVC